MTRAWRLRLVVVGMVLGGVIVAAAFTASDRLWPKTCNVLAERSRREALTLEQGGRLEDCEMLTGMSRSAVLGTAGLETPAEDRGRLEDLQLSGNRPGTIYFSSCVPQLVYVRGRVVRAGVICKDD